MIDSKYTQIRALKVNVTMPRRECLEHVPHGRVQHLATAHVRHVGRRTLSETDQHPPFCGNVLDREPRTPAITPRLGGQRIQPLPSLDTAELLEVVEQHTLFDRYLLIRIEMLESASAADAKVLATRLDSMRESSSASTGWTRRDSSMNWSGIPNTTADDASPVVVARPLR